jgi:hypothetical protein
MNEIRWRFESESKTDQFNQPALAGGILVAPGVSPGYARRNKFVSPAGAAEISVALFDGSIIFRARIPGLKPGATLCRHLKWLIGKVLSKRSHSLLISKLTSL